MGGRASPAFGADGLYRFDACFFPVDRSLKRGYGIRLDAGGCQARARARARARAAIGCMLPAQANCMRVAAHVQRT